MSTLKFRVLLDTEQESEVFRDILIDEKDNFESLYRAIISSFCFEGNQMASFYISDEDWNKGHEITLMDMSYGDEVLEEKASLMSSSILQNFMIDKNQKIILVYDFMNMWIFLIELLEKNNTQIKTPEVIFSVGMAPPEDSKNSNFEDEIYFDEEEEEFDYNSFGDDFEDGYNEEDYREYEDQ